MLLVWIGFAPFFSKWMTGLKSFESLMENLYQVKDHSITVVACGYLSRDTYRKALEEKYKLIFEKEIETKAANPETNNHSNIKVYFEWDDVNKGKVQTFNRMVRKYLFSSFSQQSPHQSVVSVDGDIIFPLSFSFTTMESVLIKNNFGLLAPFMEGDQRHLFASFDQIKSFMITQNDEDGVVKNNKRKEEEIYFSSKGEGIAGGMLMIHINALQNNVNSSVMGYDDKEGQDEKLYVQEDVELQKRLHDEGWSCGCFGPLSEFWVFHPSEMNEGYKIWKNKKLTK